ncbi:MAG: hypothetical protein BGO78_04720 [Chloroflexi bacterium 44-23]|nr:MAG: hypothetical protein BGO78_04720 [Chloroflexi bacterium 44-23]
MISADAINSAILRLNGKINITPLTFDPDLNVYIKWENHQKTGAFKVRGALNKILALETWEQERGLVAASAGNHGLGVAYAAKLLGVKATIFIPENSVINKETAMLNYGAAVIRVSGDFSTAETEAQSFAVKKGATWVSPYNDKLVIAGHATIGAEIISEIEEEGDLQCLIPVCGGGLVAGIGSAFQNKKVGVKLIGVQSANSSFFYSLYHFGSQKDVLEKNSIADGLTGAIEKNSITIPLVRSMLDDFLLVDELDIERAIAYCYFKYGEIVEGSAAVPLAALLLKGNFTQKSVLVMTGANIQSDLHASVCERWKDHWDPYEET